MNIEHGEKLFEFRSKQNCINRPHPEYRFWLYDPENNEMVYFRTPTERDSHAEKVIAAYLLDDGWTDEVELVAAGELTHFAQVLDKQMRPADEDLDEDQRDGDGYEWPEGMTWRGNYVMAPLETPNVELTGEGKRSLTEFSPKGRG